MAMQTVYFKEHEGIVHNPIGQLPPMQSVPWWSAFGSQSVYGESLGPLNSSDHSTGGDQLSVTKLVERSAQHGHDKGNATQFTIFPGVCKNSVEGQKPLPAFSMQSAPSEYRARFDLGFSQPMVCANFPYANQCYGVFSTYGSQILDHYFDVVANVVGLVAAVLGHNILWWIDPIGAIALALYTITNWSGTVLENAVTLVGQSAITNPSILFSASIKMAS